MRWRGTKGESAGQELQVYMVRREGLFRILYYQRVPKSVVRHRHVRQLCLADGVLDKRETTFGANRRVLVRMELPQMATIDSPATIRRIAGRAMKTSVQPKEQGIAAHEMDPNCIAPAAVLFSAAAGCAARGAGQENVRGISLRIERSVASRETKF